MVWKHPRVLLIQSGNDLSEIIYDFWGKISDRAEIRYEFDGLDVVIVVEDQEESSGKLKVAFSRVARFEFQSLASLSNYPTEIAEKLIEQPAPPDLISRMRPEFHRIFRSGLKQYEVFFQDIGIFSVVACSVEVTKA